MAKLYFRYGTVGSAKTLNLLAVAHNYEQQGKNVLLVKPKIDTRFGEQHIKSRAGLERKADIVVEKNSRLSTQSLYGIHCILVDEAQFLNSAFIDHLRQISRDVDIPVICYGLRTDFKTQFFVGSHRLMELADQIEEIKATCHYCNRKAIFNLRVIDGQATLAGPQIKLGTEEQYLPSCSSCYHEKISKIEREHVNAHIELR